jgi:cytochrome c-type biogenesis protein CcmF
LGLTFVVSLSLLSRRWNDLKSGVELTSCFPREALFLLNNLLFVGIFIVCFWGVIFPVLTEALGVVGQKIPALSGIFTGQKITVGPPYYLRATGPLFAGLLLLMGVAPLSAWKYSTAKTLGRAIWKPFVGSLVVVVILIIGGMRSIPSLVGFWLCAFVTFVTLYEFSRAAWARHKARNENLPKAFWFMIGKNRRRYGGYIIHLGVVLMALGIIGIEIFQTETQGTISQGEQISLGQYTLRFDKLYNWDTSDGVNRILADMSVFKNGKYVGTLYPHRDYYYEAQQPMTIAGLRSTPEDDLYVILVDWQPLTASSATFKVYHNPLVWWLWVGGFVFILGTMVAAWPDREPQIVLTTQPVPGPRKAVEA